MAGAAYATPAATQEEKMTKIRVDGVVAEAMLEALDRAMKCAVAVTSVLAGRGGDLDLAAYAARKFWSFPPLRDDLAGRAAEIHDRLARLGVFPSERSAIDAAWESAEAALDAWLAMLAGEPSDASG